MKKTRAGSAAKQESADEDELLLFDAENRRAFALAQKTWRSAIKRGWKAMSLEQLAEAAAACRRACMPDPEDFPGGMPSVRDKPDAIAGLAIQAKALGGRLDHMRAGNRSLAAVVGEAWDELPSKAKKNLSPKLLEWEEWPPARRIEKSLNHLGHLCPASAKMPKGAARALAVCIELRLRREVPFQPGHHEELQCARSFCELSPTGKAAAEMALATIAEAARSGALAIEPNLARTTRMSQRQEMLQRWRGELETLREVLTLDGVDPSEFIKEIDELGVAGIKRNREEAAWIEGCVSAIKNDARGLFSIFLDASEAMGMEEPTVIYKNDEFVHSNRDARVVTLLDCAVLHGSLECAKELFSRGRFGVEIQAASKGELPRMAPVLATLKERALNESSDSADWEEMLCKIGTGLGKQAIAQGHGPEASLAWASARIGGNSKRTPKGKSAYERLAISYAMKVRDGLFGKGNEEGSPARKQTSKARRL